MLIYDFYADKDTCVFSNQSGKPQCHCPYLLVGKVREDFFLNTEYISYVFFNLSDVPPDNRVISAKLKLNFYETSLGEFLTKPAWLGIQFLAAPFADCRTTYRNRPPVIPQIIKRVSINTKSRHMEIDVTDFVKYWLYGRVANQGLALVPVCRASNELLLFHSSHSKEARKHPLLSIKTFSNAPGEKICKINKEETHLVTEQVSYSEAVEIWDCSIYSFIVKNTGTKNILVKLQFSPDGKTYFDEEPELELSPGMSRVMVSTFFCRFVRLKFRITAQKSGNGKIKIWLQGKI